MRIKDSKHGVKNFINAKQQKHENTIKNLQTPKNKMSYNMGNIKQTR